MNQIELIQKVVDAKDIKENQGSKEQKVIQNVLNTESRFEEQIKKDKEAYAKRNSNNENESTEKKIAELFNQNEKEYEVRKAQATNN